MQNESMRGGASGTLNAETAEKLSDCFRQRISERFEIFISASTSPERKEKLCMFSTKNKSLDLEATLF